MSSDSVCSLSARKTPAATKDPFATNDPDNKMVASMQDFPVRWTHVRIEY